MAFYTKDVLGMPSFLLHWKLNGMFKLSFYPRDVCSLHEPTTEESDRLGGSETSNRFHYVKLTTILGQYLSQIDTQPANPGHTQSEPGVWLVL